MDVVQSKNDNMYSSSTLIIDQPDLTRSRLDVPPTNGFIGPGVRVANNLPPEIKKIISNAFARAQKTFKYERHISCREERFFFVFSFFFQAEDGIRDVERSRGLGDVYKRQEVDRKRGCLFPRLRSLQLEVAVGCG